MPTAPTVTLEEALAIVRAEISSSAEITAFKELGDDDLHDIRPADIRMYTIHLVSPISHPSSTSPISACLLKTAAPAASTPSDPSLSSGVSLHTEHALLTRLSTHLPPPAPIPRILGASPPSRAPFAYLLLTYPAGTPLARLAPSLSDRQRALADLRLGALLKALHALDGEFFGPPDTPPGEQLYSWQEAATLALETALDAAGAEIDAATIRARLSRAIGSFLFDDVEWPALVCADGGPHAVFADTRADGEVEITGFLAHGLSGAVWGDPLLDGMMARPSAALVEGYGGSLIVFERQRTKRVWYTLLGALVVLAQAEDGPRRERARKTVAECVERLRDAPCY